MYKHILYYTVHCNRKLLTYNYAHILPNEIQYWTLILRLIKTILKSSHIAKRCESVKAASQTRIVDVFVSRLHPSTQEAELIDSVNCANNGTNGPELKCLKFTPKFDHL